MSLPLWDFYDFNSTDNTIFNTVEYRCSKGFNFTDGKSKHITRCFYNKFWYPPFKPCRCEYSLYSSAISFKPD